MRNDYCGRGGAQHDEPSRCKEFFNELEGLPQDRGIDSTLPAIRTGENKKGITYPFETFFNRERKVENTWQIFKEKLGAKNFTPSAARQSDWPSFVERTPAVARIWRNRKIVRVHLDFRQSLLVSLTAKNGQGRLPAKMTEMQKKWQLQVALAISRWLSLT